MTTMKFQVLEYTQNQTSFLSLIIPFYVLDAISKVLVYGVDDDGYQRQPNKIHYNKIKKYIESRPDDFMLPTSVILGADKSKISPTITTEDNCKYINIDTSEKLFRVVDGQHRIFGLREAARSNPKVLGFPINVTVILSKESEKSKELQIFSDINSKSKRINTDLAELAKHDYQIKEDRLSEEEVNRHIAIKTAYYLKDQKDSNIWQNAIKFDIHAEITLGIIGVSIFSESIKSIIDKYIIENPYINKKGEKMSGNELILYTKESSNIIGIFLSKVWNDIIKVKWPGAFKEDIVKNDEGDLAKIFYNKDFYIQKGLGIKSLNPIIGDVVKEAGFGDAAFDKIKNVIFESKIKIDDWKNGGPLSGFNSESGFSKIKQMILNKIQVPPVSVK